ncbi:MAG: Holliday junction resolvase RuvX [Planctomycetota bacterium]|nr:Holliday junction resolvase RuvX [Planctomycetota bacterium]
MEKSEPETSADQLDQTKPTVPTQGRLIGLDYGTKRVGVAITDFHQEISSPLDTYYRHVEVTDRCYFRDLAAEYRAVGVVVGLPVHLSGIEGQKAREAREFGKWIGDCTQIPVTFWDERYTSAIAEDFLLGMELTSKKRKAVIDRLAAQIMLKSFLDSLDRDQTPQAFTD